MPVTIDVPGLGPVSIPDSVPSGKTREYVRQVAEQRGVKLNLPAPPPPAPDRSYGIMPAIRDIGVSAAGVIPGLIETAAEFTPADRALAAIGAQRGIAGLIPETEIGKDIGKYGVLRGTAKSLRDLQQEMYSEQAKTAQKEFQRKLAEQEGFFGQAGTAFKETLTTPELLTSQLPESVLSMLGGRGVAKAGEAAFKAVTPGVVKEAGEKAIGKAAEKLGAERVEKLAKLSGGPETIRTVAGAAAMQGASVANQNFIATMDMPQDKLAATPEYQEAIKSGLSPEEARLSVARSAANGALAPATAISVVAQYAVPGGTSFERLFAGATQRTLGAEGALQVAKQIGKATLGEAGSEALEEGGGQFIGNVFAPGQEDLMQGVGAAVGAAGAMGALMGGGAGGVQALQANRARQVIAERQQQEEQARQELDARMPPVQQIESPEPSQVPIEQLRPVAEGLTTFTMEDLGNAGLSSPDAAAVANDLINRGLVVQEPGETLSFRRVNDDERIVPLGSPDQSYVYTVPTTREGSELNDGYTVESSALGLTRQVANQEEAEKIKQAMIERAGQRAAVVDEQLNNLQAQANEVSDKITEASINPNISDEQLKDFELTGLRALQQLNDEIAKLEEQKATILAEPTVTPINPRAETGYQVRLYTPGQPARILSNFANEQEAYDAIIDNSTPEQDRLIAEDPAYENVRRRLEERAAQVDVEESAPEPVEMTPEMQERVTQTANRMRSVLDQMGLQNIGLNVQQRLQRMVNGELSDIDGVYLNRVISASLEGSRDVTATIGHETIHALRELGMFSDKEWEILTNRAKSKWIKKYEIRKRYQGMLTEEKVIEEAIADAFGDWLQGDLKERGVVAGLFNRIKLVLEKMGSVLRGQGFTTSSDIFKRARTGTLEGDRVERIAEGKQYAIPRAGRTELGFYSALADSIESLPASAAPAAGWKQAIKGLVNKGAVKPDEVEWSGVDDWLDLQQGKVNKQQVADYLKQGGVQLEETVLDEEVTRYGGYTLPGGENYREVLLKLPIQVSRGEVSPRAERVAGELNNDVLESLPDEAVASYSRKMGEIYGVPAEEMELAIRVARGEREVSTGYRSAHWEQPNIIAHIRVNDRTDAEGKRVLFVEELQSDWAQEGRKKGIGKRRIGLTLNEENPESFPYNGKPGFNFIAEDGSSYTGYGDTEEEAKEDLYKSLSSLTKEGVPSAPFIKSTEGWLNLALKRIIVMAAEGGYDKVAFINGEQSAERYDLSKQIQSIGYDPKSERLEAYDKNRDQVLDEYGVTADKLEGYVGKEVAQRLLATETVMGKHLLDGEDLRVGGKGMIAFYDQIVPTAVKKLIGKMGGKMESVLIAQGRDTEPVSGIDVMDYLGIPERQQREYWANLTNQERDQHMERYRMRGSTAGAQKQPGFSITPEMREKVEEGIPQFALPRTVNVDGVERPTSVDGRPIHPTAEGVQNFWRWFGNSNIVNADGTPKIMYHGTPHDISVFEPRQAKAIFVTEDPTFASTFAGKESSAIYNAIKVMKPEKQKQVLEQAIKTAIKEGYISKEFASRARGMTLNMAMKVAGLGDVVQEIIQEGIEAGPNIIPLFVRAEKPFDYENEEHLADVRKWINSLDKNNPARIYLEDEFSALKDGGWSVIESPALQSFIRDNGYDSFYMEEGGRKNLAVYDPNQLKSAVGNTGAFSRDSGEIQYALPLTPEETQDIVKRARGDADLVKKMLGLAANMTPEEREKLSRANAVKMIDLLGTFPTAEEYAAIAYAGRAKRGWYENSAKALITVFGNEAPRFAALLAALSPQCSVQTNLKNTLNVWKNWTAAGRPTNRAAIMQIMAVSVEGTGTEKSVLGAWKNNAVRALTAQNFIDFKLSGPKVNSFYLNLIGVTEEVTNDTWMANFAFVNQTLFSGSLNKKGTDPGKGSGYLATNVVVRQAADRLTELTGQKWTPAEVQETVWSWAKALYEGAESEGLSPVQFLTDGKLTDELINSVPDFKSLFFDETYESILREAGYGQQLEELVRQRNANRAELSEQEQGAATETGPFTPTTQKEFEVAAAERLEKLKQKREREKAIKAKKPAISFEVAPDPDDIALNKAWKELSPKEQLSISERILNKLLPDILNTLGVKGFLFNQVGSYLEDTNPSFSFKVTKGDAARLTNYLGFIFSQNEMVVASPNKFKNAEKRGSVIVEINDDSPSNVEQIYNTLREIEVNGEKIVGGQSTSNGRMVIFNYSELSTEEVAKLVNDKLDDKYKVKTGTVYASYPSKEDYNYASRESDPRGNEGNIRERSRVIRNEAAQEIRRELAAAGIKISDTPGGKPEVSTEPGQFALPQNILGQPATLPTWTNPTDSKSDNAIYYLMDKMIDLKRVIEGITKSGAKILDQWNPYLKEELYHGRTAQQTERFLRTEVRPLLQDLSRNNITIAELEEYLHNRHAEERNIQVASVNPNLPDGGSGITTQKANNYLNAIPQQRRMLLERLARRIDDINKGTRDILVNSGLESPQAIAAWENTYKKYVPLFREDADYVTSSGYGVGEGFNVRGDFAKRAIGSTRGVVDIFANVVNQRERAIIRAEKNRVAKALYGLAVQNPNKQFWMVIDPEGIQDPNQVRTDLMNLGIDPSDVANIFQQPTQARIDPRTGLVTNKLDPFILKSDNVLATRIDGKNKYILFNNNDPVAKRMVTSIKNMDADQLGRVLSTLGMVTRWIASVNTQYNPIFGVVNFTRDIQGALLNLSTTPIADKAKDVMSAGNLAGALKGIWSTARAENAGGALPTSQWAKLWQDFKDQGGQTGFRSQFSTSEERAIALEKEINSITAGKPRKAFNAMIDVLSDYNTAMENAVRLTAYKAALDKGISKEQAASIAKNLTVNFNKKGQVATQMGALYAFFNASVRGTARLYETMTGPLGKKIIWGGLLLGAMQAMMLAAAGFDEDEPPEFVKDRNLVVPLGFVTDKKNYLTIPMPLGFNVLPNFSRNMVEWFQSGFKDPAKRIAHITGSMLDMFNPIGNAGWSFQTLAPSALDPLVALGENKDSFGRPIAREDISGLDPTPGYTRTKDVSTILGKGLAEFLNAASGGTKYRPGIISPTGDQIDYLFGQVGGGIYRELAKTEQTIRSSVTGEELPSYKIPLVGRFYGNADDNAVQMQRFYTNLTRLNEHENEIKGRMKNREPIADYVKENPEVRLIKMANGIEYNIRKLKQRRDLMKERGADEKTIKNINDNIIRLMKRLNDQVTELED